jgi:hypothetical protein
MRCRAIVLILLISSHLTEAQSLMREPVEEVVAVVDRTPILKSDIDLAELVELRDRSPGETDTLYRSRLMDARIQLEVQFRDLEASGVLYRLDLDVAGVRQSLIDRAGGDQTVRPELEAAGLNDADLDELALRLSATDAYAEQRLRPRVGVSLDEIETSYRSLVVDLESQGDEAPPLTAVHDQLYRLIAERKLNDEIEEWVSRALEQRVVTRFVE